MIARTQRLSYSLPPLIPSCVVSAPGLVNCCFFVSSDTFCSFILSDITAILSVLLPISTPLHTTAETHKRRHAASSSPLTLTRSCPIHTYQSQWTGWPQSEIEFAVTGSCQGFWELDQELCSSKSVCTSNAFNSDGFPMTPGALCKQQVQLHAVI